MEKPDKNLSEPTQNRGNGEIRPTGLPIFHSWRSIYFFVLVLFAIYVALLVILERRFS